MSNYFEFLERLALLAGTLFLIYILVIRTTQNGGSRWKTLTLRGIKDESHLPLSLPLLEIEYAHPFPGFIALFLGTINGLFLLFLFTTTLKIGPGIYFLKILFTIFALLCFLAAYYFFQKYYKIRPSLSMIINKGLQVTEEGILFPKVAIVLDEDPHKDFEHFARDDHFYFFPWSNVVHCEILAHPETQGSWQDHNRCVCYFELKDPENHPFTFHFFLYHLKYRNQLRLFHALKMLLHKKLIFCEESQEIYGQFLRLDHLKKNIKKVGLPYYMGSKKAFFHFFGLLVLVTTFFLVFFIAKITK